MPLYSVVIPLYNARAYIAACLNSVIAQTLDDWEMVVVDDGSTDDSGNVVRRYMQRCPSRITLVTQPNQGQYQARRAGYRRAHGEYIVSLDADDALEPYALERIDRLLDESKADAVIFNAYRGMSGQKTMLKYPPTFLERTLSGAHMRDVYERLVASDDLNNIFTKVFRTELLIQTPQRRFAASMRMAEDAVQVADALIAAQSVYVTNERLYRYRQHAGGVTASLSLSAFDDLAALVEFLKNSFASLIVGCDDLARTHYAATFCRFVRQAFGGGLLTRETFVRLVSDTYAARMLAEVPHSAVRMTDRPLLRALRTGNYDAACAMLSCEWKVRAVRTALMRRGDHDGC